MKKILLILFIVNCSLHIGYSQSGWIEQNSGSQYNLWDIKFINSMTGVAVGEYGTITKTTNGGVNWIVHWISNVNAPISVSVPTANDWFVGDNAGELTGRVFKTTNAGLSWDTTYTPHGGISIVDFVNASTGFAICKYFYFMKTTDGGNNWKDTNLLLSQNWAMDFMDANTGIIGNSRSNMGTYRTSDEGATWNTVANEFNSFTGAVQFVNSNTVYAGNTNLYKSTDGGINWQYLFTSGQTNDIVHICFVNPDSGYIISNAIYKTTNGGVSFDSISIIPSELSFFFTDMMTGYGAGIAGKIIKTTNGGAPIGIQPISNEVPNNFMLQQNYPNPFNPVTKIKFSVPASLSFGEGPRVRLIIYDITGREVATLLNEQLSPDTYEVEWDGTNFASGIYFYQLISGEFIQTKKMVLLK